MTRAQLAEQIRLKNSYLCVGLDSDISKLPAHLRSSKNPQLEFNKKIIQATLDHCVAYKINTAFYESQGISGWETLHETVASIPRSHFIIADAKRGDIGNTSAHYAKAFFEELKADAVTVAPYMGEDSIRPFLDYEGKWTIVLGLTSNPGSSDFEMLDTGGDLLFERILKKTAEWGNPDNLMFVVGATKHELVGKIRRSYPDHFFLVPGVGAQGGSLKQISTVGMNKECGLLVNASRAIIFASSDENFAEAAADVSSRYQSQMQGLLASVF